MKKRILAGLLTICLIVGMLPVMAFAAEESKIETYEDFLYYLGALEELAQVYADQNPGKDPVLLVIKYIRTGVDRYNSGSWNIMAGYEDAGFASFVEYMEAQVNKELQEGDEPFRVTSMKNIEEFKLPNGDWVDFGHMFGTMDLSYHNKGSQEHADVGGWAGDLVDLMTSADRAYAKFNDSTADSTVALELPSDLDVEVMAEQIRENIFLKATSTDDKFTRTDYYGDIDGMYVIDRLYEKEYEVGDMAKIIGDYCTKDLSDEDRAAYFMSARLGNTGTRAQVRTIIYDEFCSNKTIETLEGTRDWLNKDSAYRVALRKAVCYALADYVCELAGDYVEDGENPCYEDFDSAFSQLAPGITQEIRKAIAADDKQMVYYLATADLSNPYVTVNANYGENDPTKWQPVDVLTQAKAAQEKRSDPENEHYRENYQVITSVNADGFNMANGTPSGILVMDGVEWNAPNGNGFFGITKEGKAVIGTTQEYKTIYKDQIRDAVSGFGVTLVKDGKITEGLDNSTRAPRTAVGITRTGKVVFMVVDGRGHSCGGSMREIAQIMLEAGCVTAINLDGGGSTTYVSKPEGSDELQVINDPSDGVPRNVSSSLLMVSTAPSSTAFDHAIIESDYNFATVGTKLQLKAAGVSATGNQAEMPEGYTWTVSDPTMATVTQDGVFTGLLEGPVEVQLMLDEKVIGSKTVTMVVPTSVYFTRKNISAVYGSSINLPIAALYESKPVAISAADVTLAVEPSNAGSVDGFKFTANESEVKNAVVTATLSTDETITGSIVVNLYKQGENTFDFDQKDGGDDQLGWTRTVTNALFDGKMVYSAEDREKDMDISYIFAVDMSHITMPEKLRELTYMLPNGTDSSTTAWDFLLTLAERISVQTEVTAKIRFDERFDLDLSQMKIINEYFYLKEDGIDINEETNEVTLTLKWKDQIAAIDAATANPMCIINGIKLTVKEGVSLKDLGTVTVTNAGSISYKVYMRATSLYSFCLDEANQEQFGLMPFAGPTLDDNGAIEKGGYFVNDDYKTFEDMFVLSYAMKQGWSKEDGGWVYYVDDEILTGIQKLPDGFYYDFGEDGFNAGQARFTGFFTDEIGKHYVLNGVIQTTGWANEDGMGYHCHEDGCLHEATINDSSTCIKGGWITYVCKTCNNTPARVGDYVFPQGHNWDADYNCRICGHSGQDITKALKVKLSNGGKETNPGQSYYYQTGGTRLGAYITFDNEYILTYSNDNNVIQEGPMTHYMKDLYVTWNNDRGIGKVTMTVNGRGNYYGITSMDYYIVPVEVKELIAETVAEDDVLLKWTRGNNGVDGADGYRIYLDDGDKKVDSGDKLIADVTGTSYLVNDLEAGEYTFYVVSYAVSDNDTENGKIYNSPTAASKMSFATTTIETAVPALEVLEVVPGEGEDEVEIAITFISKPKTDGSWSVIAAAYDDEGMLVSVTSQEITGESLTVALKNIQSAGQAVIYVVGSNWSPLLEPAVIDMASGTLLSQEIEMLSFEDFCEDNQVFVEDADFACQE